MTHNIRKMTPVDITAVQKIALELHISRTQRKDGFLVAQPSLEEIGFSDQAYVAEENGEVIGFTLFYTPPAFEQAFGHQLTHNYPQFILEPTAWFGFLMGVKIKGIRGGIGRSLLERVVDEAKRVNVKRFYAEVVEGNPVLSYHLRVGWSLTGAKRNYLHGHTVNLIEKRVE